MKIVRLTPEHILAVQLQPAQAFAHALVDLKNAQDLADSPGVAWSAVEGGEVIACAGILELHAERGMAWAMLSERALRQFKTIHRVVSQVVDAAPWRRVEMAVDARHATACAWAERLGFKREGHMQAYTADGRDCFLYARVK
ncbi:hypothetical protein [Orrella dioscoreae]|uniref:hypothetical protein n=1 Tax=Orrella dioscoreae TaxID=1851544 RepID=UPI00082A8468|nr:hypothetical protein [Orrella dioscoreae]